jgi:hypothetical protein
MIGGLFTDADRVVQRIKDDIAPKVAADQGYQNAKKNTPNTARLEHDKALERVIVSLLKDDTELFKQFFQNESFRRFVTDAVFNLTNLLGAGHSLIFIVVLKCYQQHASFITHDFRHTRAMLEAKR